LPVRRSLGQGPEVKGRQRPAGGAAGDARRGAGDAVADRAGHPERGGRVWAGRGRDAGAGGAAPPHGAAPVGRVVAGPPAVEGRGKTAGLSVPGVRAVLVDRLDRRGWDEDEIVRWPAWRRERNRCAAESHKERRAKLARRHGERQPAL
jgi:hypothetical protein